MKLITFRKNILPSNDQRPITSSDCTLEIDEFKDKSEILTRKARTARGGCSSEKPAFCRKWSIVEEN